MTDEIPAPPLFGEDWLSALLLAMLVEHCGGFSPENRRRMTSYFAPDPSPGEWLDSYNSPANAEAMRELDGSEIEIIEQDGAHIVAKVTPAGRALLDRLRAEQEREAKPLVPNKETIDAMKAAERGEVTTVGHPRKLLKSLNADDPENDADP